ncbi:MAG TPA: radical SAM protein [Elusimicrobiota bacterium]|nr:radical SAM protein [Elusimicrobiota bacterium]
MSQIILFYPLTGLDVKEVTVFPPMALMALASSVTDRYSVRIIDQRFCRDWKREIRNEIGPETLCFGVSTMTGTQIRHASDAARFVRRINKDIPIVWGGVHPTLMPEQTAADPLVDVAVAGAGEKPFRSLVDCLAEKNPWTSIPQLAFKQGGAVRYLRDDARSGDVSHFSYESVDVEKYVYGSLLFGRRVRALPFISSVGCPHECAFCCQPMLSGRKWIRLSPVETYERVIRLVDRYKLEAVLFDDDEFFVNADRGMEIARLINGQFEWYVQTRMDDLSRVDLGELERCGLRVVQPGLETGSPRILELLKKKETVELYKTVNRRLAQTSIQAIYNFMMGFPGESIDELTATVDLALELMAENPRSRIAGFYVYVPYPGAALYDLAVQQGFQPPRSLGGWSAFSREHRATPWIQENKDLYETLFITSKFIDQTRLHALSEGKPFVRTVFNWLNDRYTQSWRSHSYEKTWDVRLLSALYRLNV